MPLARAKSQRCAKMRGEARKGAQGARTCAAHLGWHTPCGHCLAHPRGLRSRKRLKMRSKAKLRKTFWLPAGYSFKMASNSTTPGHSGHGTKVYNARACGQCAESGSAIKRSGRIACKREVGCIVVERAQPQTTKAGPGRKLAQRRQLKGGASDLDISTPHCAGGLDSPGRR